MTAASCRPARRWQSGRAPARCLSFFSTATTSSVIISCQFPSLSVVMDRYVTLQGGIYLRFVATPAAVVDGAVVAIPGQHVALAPLPLQRLCSSQTVTINGQSTTFQTSQLIDVVTRMLASKRTSAHSASPIRSDFFALASTGAGGLLSPYAAVNDSYDELELRSGSWPFVFTDPRQSTAGQRKLPVRDRWCELSLPKRHSRAGGSNSCIPHIFTLRHTCRTVYCEPLCLWALKRRYD